MQLWRPEFELDRINSGSWCHCLPVRILLIVRERERDRTAVVCKVVCWIVAWPVRKENEVALQQAEMRIVRWTYGIKVKDRVQVNRERERERERLG